MCIICLWARLVRSWYQLGATWIQLGPNLASIPANMWKLTLKWLQSDQKVSIERLVHIRKSSKSIGKMYISEKRSRHSQSYVEVILSIENVPKMYHKCAPDPHQGHPCCSLVVPLPFPFPYSSLRRRMLAGCGPFGGSRKSVYNLFMGSFGPILVPTWRNVDPSWTQLGPSLDPTWHQFQPTCEN